MTNESTTTTTLSQERQDILEALRNQRELFRGTTTGMSDEQAATRSTVSELCLGGLIKHVALVEESWARFAVDGPDAFAGEAWTNVDWEPTAADEWDTGFTMLPGETLAELMANYETVANRTDELVASIDLDSGHPLPPAPWFPPGATWSARRVFAHIVAETAQHSGHADIVREAIDGAKSMG